MITEDLTIFLNDFGVSCTAGATTALGILDMPGNLTADGMAISTDYTLRCKTSDFGNLSYGSEMLISGIQYQVREVRLIDDGVFLEISLMRLDPGVSAVGNDLRQMTMNDLSDVAINNPTQGDVLIYNSTDWTNTQEIDGGSF